MRPYAAIAVVTANLASDRPPAGSAGIGGLSSVPSTWLSARPSSTPSCRHHPGRLVRQERDFGPVVVPDRHSDTTSSSVYCGRMPARPLVSLVTTLLFAGTLAGCNVVAEPGAVRPSSSSSSHRTVWE